MFDGRFSSFDESQSLQSLAAEKQKIKFRIDLMQMCLNINSFQPLHSTFNLIGHCI